MRRNQKKKEGKKRKNENSNSDDECNEVVTANHGNEKAASKMLNACMVSLISKQYG
jgi:hypothetical protein